MGGRGSAGSREREEGKRDASDGASPPAEGRTGETHGVEQSFLPNVSIHRVRPFLPDSHESREEESQREEQNSKEVAKVETEEERFVGEGGVLEGCLRRFGVTGGCREGCDDHSCRDEEDGDDLEARVSSTLEEVVGEHRDGESSRSEDDVNWDRDLKVREKVN